MTNSDLILKVVRQWEFPTKNFRFPSAFHALRSFKINDELFMPLQLFCHTFVIKFFPFKSFINFLCPFHVKTKTGTETGCV